MEGLLVNPSTPPPRVAHLLHFYGPELHSNQERSVRIEFKLLGHEQEFHHIC